MISERSKSDENYDLLDMTITVSSLNKRKKNNIEAQDLISPLPLTEEIIHRMTSSWVVSPKVDGERCLCVIDQGKGYYVTMRGERIDPFLVCPLVTCVLDVEKMSEKTVILDVLATSFPVRRKGLRERMQSLDTYGFLSNSGFEYQRYIPLYNFKKSTFCDNMEGFILQDSLLPYDKNTLKIYKVKYNETLDIELKEGKCSLFPFIDYENYSGIVEVDLKGQVLRKRLDKDKANHDVIQAKVMTSVSVPDFVNGVNQMKIREEQVVVLSRNIEVNNREKENEILLKEGLMDIEFEGRFYNKKMKDFLEMLKHPRMAFLFPREGIDDYVSHVMSKVVSRTVDYVVFLMAGKQITFSISDLIRVSKFDDTEDFKQFFVDEMIKNDISCKKKDIKLYSCAYHKRNCRLRYSERFFCIDDYREEVAFWLYMKSKGKLN